MQTDEEDQKYYVKFTEVNQAIYDCETQTVGSWLKKTNSRLFKHDCLDHKVDVKAATSIIYFLLMGKLPLNSDNNNEEFDTNGDSVDWE